jgi:MOSC domain-containing protein YiiM
MVGQPREIRAGCRTSLGRRPADLLKVGTTTVEGDACADARHHGGPDKVLHVYPSEHYARWHAQWPATPDMWQAGAFGENLSTVGVTEATQCIGDILQIGSALLQVSQGRQPCWKLNVAFGRPDMARDVQASGRMGWYLRTLRPGLVHPGDSIVLMQRPHPDWPLARVHRCLFLREHTEAELQTLAHLTHLSASWRRLFTQRLQSGTCESFDSRLNTPVLPT